jgi:hypothetical protein
VVAQQFSGVLKYTIFFWIGDTVFDELTMDERVQKKVLLNRSLSVALVELAQPA